MHRFHSPSNGNGLFWYSFDIGPVHVVFYSTEHDFRPSSPQYIWLENDLRSVNRTRSPWLIVGAHRYMYSSWSFENLMKEKLQEYLEPLLYKYQVDLHLVAHLHSYERTCKVYKKQCVPDGITHVLIGMAGYNIVNLTYEPETWSVYHDIAYGYTCIRANKTHLSFYYHHSVDDKIYDHFTLEK